MCCILRAWKLKTLINTSHLLGFGMEGSGRQNQLYFTCLEVSGRLNVSYSTCLEAQNADKFITFARSWDGRLWEEGSGRLNVSYSTCLEAQNVDKYITFARLRGRKAPGSKINRILRVWKALGGKMCSILRVWKLKTLKNTSHLVFGRKRSLRLFPIRGKRSVLDPS